MDHKVTWSTANSWMKGRLRRRFFRRFRAELILFYLGRASSPSLNKVLWLPPINREWQTPLQKQVTQLRRVMVTDGMKHLKSPSMLKHKAPRPKGGWAGERYRIAATAGSISDVRIVYPFIDLEGSQLTREQTSRKLAGKAANRLNCVVSLFHFFISSCILGEQKPKPWSPTMKDPVILQALCMGTSNTYSGIFWAYAQAIWIHCNFFKINVDTLHHKAMASGIQ